MNRAYSLLEIKSIDAERRTITGIATTPTPDRQGDSIDPLGVSFTNPLPLLWHHDAKAPVGTVTLHPPTANGVTFTAYLPIISQPGKAKDRVDEAWDSLTSTPPLIRGTSIGWKDLAPPIRLKSGVLRWPKTLIGELSLVTIPANIEATILSVKQYDQPSSAAFGTRRVVPSRPGISGQRTQHPAMTISEQVTTEQTNLQVKSARLEELMQADETENGLEAGEETERTTLVSEIKALTAKLDTLTTIEAAQLGIAKTLPLSATKTATRFPRVEVKPVELEKGTLFTRYAMAVAAGKGSYSDTIAYAKRWDAQTPEVSAYVKAAWGQKAVEGTSVVASPGWGGALVNPNTMATEFVELVRAETIIGKVPGFRKVPFNIPIITQTGGSTFEWVGEGGVKPVGELAFTRTTMPYHKVAGIVVLSDELVRLSTPNAEETARRDLVEQCAVFLDQQFIRIAVTAGADNPASITNGVTAPNASGTTLAALKADLNTALGTLTAAGVTLSGLVIVTTSEVALRLSLMTTTLGTTPSGISMTPSGGTLLGYPVIVSDSVDADSLVIFKPSEIFLADDGRVTLDASNQATLDMGTGGSPATPTFNLWQRNCVGIRAERWINWQKRKPTVVAIIDTIAYVPGT